MWVQGKKIKVCKLCGKEGHTPFKCPFKQCKTKPKSNRSKLIHELDKLYSQYCRKSQIMRNGHCYCFICGKHLSYDKACIGHYISRRYIGTRFEPFNANVICYSCNLIDKNQPEILQKYKERIIQAYGEEELDYLNHRKNIKLSTPEIEELIKFYKSKLKKL